MPIIALRPIEDADLDALFDQSRDPEAVQMAAFTAEDPDDRRTFDAHMARVRSSPETTLRAITCDGQLIVLPAPNPPLIQMITGPSYPANPRVVWPRDLVEPSRW